MFELSKNNTVYFGSAVPAAGGGSGSALPDQTGQSGKFLTTDGTDASWGDAPAPSVMTGATASAAGTSGLVPAPAAGDQAKYLTGAGTWATPAAGLTNTATGTGSLGILGEVGSSTSYSTVVGADASTFSAFNVVIGNGAESKNSADAVVIGASAVAGTSYAAGGGVAIGYSSKISNAASIAIGNLTQATGSYSIAIGGRASGHPEAKATATASIQIGPGTNSTANTFSVGLDASHNYQLLDANGQIPAARLGTGFDASKTQVLKNVNGVLTWVDEA